MAAKSVLPRSGQPAAPRRRFGSTRHIRTVIWSPHPPGRHTLPGWQNSCRCWERASIP